MYLTTEGNYPVRGKGLYTDVRLTETRDHGN